jgi:hypothetical protein
MQSNKDPSYVAQYSNNIVLEDIEVDSYDEDDGLDSLYDE